MKFHFDAMLSLHLEKYPNKTKPTIKQTKFRLEPSDVLDKKMYVQEDGLLTEAGTKALTHVLVQGLIGNIHQSHQRGLIDSAEHLRHIIAELERGFVAQVDYSIGRMGDGEE
jgi:hypothetical protein